MTSRKEDEIMAEYLLKGGKMLEKSCKTCGCPLFEVKGKTLCVVCAENGPATNAAPAPHAAAAQTAAHAHHHEHGESCSCGVDHDEDSCDCDDDESGLTEELAFTIHSLCLRIQNERDPGQVLILMNAVKSGTEALEVLCRL
jgi:UPF0148 protein